jgi:GMP synthase (glutamine-hydrolysing)
VLILKAGDVADPVFEKVGDYDRWFVPALRAAGVSSEVVCVHRGQRLMGQRADGIVITGSPLSVTEPSPWMRRLAEALRSRIDVGTPLLGVCFGHQLLSWAYGTPVVRSARGREIGSVMVELTEAGQCDPLFANVPRRFCVQATHEDVAARRPVGAIELARNAHGLQALAFGPHVRTVQFHPELSAEGMRAVIGARASTVERESRGRFAPGERVRQLQASVQTATFGATILRNFLTRFV